MKKAKNNTPDEMEPEYDFRGCARGLFYRAYRKDAKVTIIEDDDEPRASPQRAIRTYAAPDFPMFDRKGGRHYQPAEQAR